MGIEWASLLSLLRLVLGNLPVIGSIGLSRQVEGQGVRLEVLTERVGRVEGLLTNHLQTMQKQVVGAVKEAVAALKTQLDLEHSRERIGELEEEIRLLKLKNRKGRG